MRPSTILFLLMPIRICSWGDDVRVPTDTWAWGGAAPVPTIEEPRGGTVVAVGATLHMVGVVDDPDGWPQGTTAEWFFGESIVACAAAPLQEDWRTECTAPAPRDPGTYDVWLLARDETGQSGWAQVRIEVVPSTPPIVTLYSPAPGSVWHPAVPIPFVARIADLDGLDGLEVSWFLDGVPRADLATPVLPDGIVATAAYLDPGLHEIAVQVDDGVYRAADRVGFEVVLDPDADTDTDTGTTP